MIIAILMAAAVATPPAPDGAKAFTLQCASCHGAKTTLMGPSLSGVAGGPVAATPGFTFSAALKAKGGVWSDDRLDAYLKAPAAFAPGSRMPTSVPDAAKRAALIAYLKTLK